jgi:hypothetical protein
MVFKNFGGIHQLQVADAEDLGRIDGLDPARWAATSAPLRDLHCDPAFLDFLDPGKAGRIRVAQLVAAREWVFERLARRDALRGKSEVLRLEDLDSGREAGRRLQQAAEHVLAELGVKEPDSLSLAQVRAFRSGYAQTLANGDGIVPPEVIPEPEVASLAHDVISIAGSSMDASQRPGVGSAELDRSVERARAYLEWKARPAAWAEILPWGEDTAAAAETVHGLDAKLEEYFWLCDLVRQEAPAAAQLRASEEELRALKATDASGIERYLAASPLAAPTASGQLSLAGAVNPVYQERFEALRAQVLTRALGAGATDLTRTSWRRVRALFEPYFAWQRDRPAEPFHTLPDSRIEQLLRGPLLERLRHFIAVDQDAADELAQIADLEKLILHQRWLVELVNNFVNFSAIYNPKQTALIEMGTLVIDGRRLEFCIRVENREAHKKVAAESQIFLVYAAISEQDQKSPAFEVAAPVTSGERGRLRVGKRGLFIDTAGREWDAQVVDLLESPISLAEAIRAPFRRAWSYVGKKIEDLVGTQLAASEKSMHEGLDKGMELEAAVPGVQAAPQATAKTTVPAGGGMGLQGLLLGGGIAFAAVGSTVAYLLSALSQISPLRMFGAVASLAGLVVLFSGVLGWLKLRRRDMGPLLEANGWAINANMRLTRRLQRVFTRIPGLPRGSRTERPDVLQAFLNEARDAERSFRRRRRLVALLVSLGLAALAVFLWLRWAGGLDLLRSWIAALRPRP